MATSVQSSTWRNTTDADFRAWGKAVSDGIAAVGLVQVADAGTVNWATVVKPTANAAQGFEIWRFDDALQATHPVFIKVEYGAENNASFANPMMWVTVGRGSDGSGSITNILAPRRQVTAYGATTTGTPPTSIEPIYISSDGSSLCVSARTGDTMATIVHAPAFVVDRSRDSAGTPTAAGGVILTEGSGSAASATSQPNAASAQMHAWTYAGDSTMGDVPAVVPATVNGLALSASTSLAVGDKAPVFPYIVAVPNHEPWQVMAAVAVLAGDAANGPFTANVMGKIRTYRSIPVGTSHNRWMTGRDSLGYTGLCILWES